MQDDYAKINPTFSSNSEFSLERPICRNHIAEEFTFTPQSEFLRGLTTLHSTRNKVGHSCQVETGQRVRRWRQWDFKTASPRIVLIFQIRWDSPRCGSFRMIRDSATTVGSCKSTLRDQEREAPQYAHGILSFFPPRAFLFLEVACSKEDRGRNSCYTTSRAGPLQRSALIKNKQTDSPTLYSINIIVP